jgi:hypothetical protein
MHILNESVEKNCSNERLKTTSNVENPRFNTTLHPSYPSQRSSNDDDNKNNKEQIWIKRRLSNHAIEKLFDRRKPFLWKEIIDVTV